MSDTPTNTTGLQTLFADNTTGAITPQGLRDFVVSVGNIVDGIDASKLTTGSSNITLRPATGKLITLDDDTGATQLTVNEGYITVNGLENNGPLYSDSELLTSDGNGNLSTVSVSGNGSGLTNLNAANITGTALPAISGHNLTSLNASNISTGTLADARLSTNIPLLNAANTFSTNQTITGTVSATTFSGSGASLTSLNGSNVASGTVADARLSTNIPLKNASNTFSVGQTITGTCTATTFSGSGASLTSLPAGNLTGSLPAISGHLLTSINPSNLGNGSSGISLTPSPTGLLNLNGGDGKNVIVITSETMQLVGNIQTNQNTGDASVGDWGDGPVDTFPIYDTSGNLLGYIPIYGTAGH